jgi:hypothetical protein
VVPEQRRVPGGDYVIGRGADASWVLPDPDRLLSKHHCVVEFRGGGWQLRDLSTNGTFVNHSDAPVGRDQVKPLEDGDRLRLGAYEIEVRVAVAGGQSAGSAGAGRRPRPAADGISRPRRPVGISRPRRRGGVRRPPRHRVGGRRRAAAARAIGAGRHRATNRCSRGCRANPYLGAKPPEAGMPGLPGTSGGLPGGFDPYNEGPAMPTTGLRLGRLHAAEADAAGFGDPG